VKSEEQIIEAIRHGENGWQDLMVGHYGQVVFSMVARQVPDVMDAEELTQDTFLRAFRYISSYDSQKASIATWLCRIAYRLTIDFLRRKRPVILSIEESEVWQTDISNEQLEADLSTGNEERISKLELLIDDLPPEERLLLTLYYYENRSLDECSFIMDSNPRILAKRLYKIRKKLHKILMKS
jgi:RNA polymerase sigma-70 factor (ECF subfamily)